MLKTRFAALLLLTAATWACGGAASPTSPTPTMPRDTGAPAGSFSLSGTVSEATPTTTGALSGAQVDVIDPQYAGGAVTSDAGGAFRLDGLRGPVMLRVTKAGYEPTEQRVDMLENRTVSIGLMPTRQDLIYTVTGTLDTSKATCSDGSYQKPCVVVSLPIHYEGLMEADLDWTPGADGVDLDIALFKGAMYLFGSSQMHTKEHIQYILEPGTMYELHITYYSGSAPAHYTLKLRRPN